MTMLVAENTRITLNFTLRLATGDLVDQTRAPATFDFGDGKLPPAFEALLLGMRAGEQQSFRIAPEQAFGQPNPNNVQAFSRAQFAQMASDDQPPAVGMVVSFADARKQELPGVICALEEDQVLVDFNHPLAGRELIFEAEIVAVQNR